jgi:hypothetical protein
LEKTGNRSSITQGNRLKNGKIWAEDIRAVISALRLNKPVLAGWSYDGFIICDKQNLSRGRVEKLNQLILLCALLSGCSHLVKISYPPEAVINPAFDQPTMNWEGERVQVVLTPSLQGEPLKYLANHEKVFLANSLRQRAFATNTRSSAKAHRWSSIRGIRTLPRKKNITRTAVLFLA